MTIKRYKLKKKDKVLGVNDNNVTTLLEVELKNSDTIVLKNVDRISSGLTTEIITDRSAMKEL